MLTIPLPTNDDWPTLTPEQANQHIDQITAALAEAHAALDRLRIIATADANLDQAQANEEQARGVEPPADNTEWDPSVTYRRDARVTFDGISYTSLVPYNRGWQPDQTTGHAWTRDAPEPDEPGGVAPWAAGVAYSVGDEVTHGGKRWRCKTAHTSHDGWAPSIHTHAVWEDLGAA